MNNNSNKYYNYELKDGVHRFILRGLLRPNSFMAQSHLSKFIKRNKYSNSGFFTIIECNDSYSYEKIKRILDSNLNDNCFIDYDEEFEFELVV